VESCVRNSAVNGGVWRSQLRKALMVRTHVWWDG